MRFESIAIGREAEEGKHEFLIRRKIEIIKMGGESLNGKCGGLFFTAVPSSEPPHPPSLFPGSLCHFFHLAHCIACL